MHSNNKFTSDPQQSILAAAIQRFSHYGYGKTTMADIATDVDMSAANLYRFFRNKEDIAAECARTCLDERALRLRNVLEKNNSASQLLHDFVLELLRYTREQAVNNPRINELVNTIAESHHEIIVMKNEGEQQIIENILLRGIESGEFPQLDTADYARTIHKALFFFQIPLPLPHYPVEELEELAAKIVRLLISGIKR